MSISNRDLLLISNSPLFDEDWYTSAYPDVPLSGLSPAEHYIRFGAILGRDPSLNFQAVDYLEMHPDVKSAGMNPLLHFEKYGRNEGRVVKKASPTAGSIGMMLARHRALPVKTFASTDEARSTVQHILSVELAGKPQRFFPDFDLELEDTLLGAAKMLYERDPSHYDAIKASVIMPVYNRADSIGLAIQSIQAQTHSNFEILIVDDGSTDGLRNVLEEFSGDPRVRTFWNNHQGVSAARNTGLENASGELIFYLDSDNHWTENFLATMIVAFDCSESPCIYGASKLQNSRDGVLGYRGEPFNWDHCLAGNYIDMNVFAHRANLVTKYGPFDVTLERMVDWDLILRYTRQSGASYCPILGCIYFEDSEDTRRITTSKPYVYRKIVHQKNELGLATTAETFGKLSLKFAIKISAPHKVRHAWGDFHYAESLQAALKRLGHEVRIDFLEDWDKHPVNSADVTLVLRGLSSYKPKPNEFSILWNISHPDQISYEEYDLYKMVYVASTSYAALLSKVLERPVHSLLQCTDTDRFSFRSQKNISDVPGVFVGNSRNEYRDIVRWSVEIGAALDIYGQRWQNFVPIQMVKQENLPNDELADVYASGRFVLNDHWASMRDFGIISNRIFDVVGCGGRLVSDRIASIEHLFGGTVEMVDSAEDLKATLSNEPPVSQAQRRAASALVHANHSFDARAAQIVDQMGSMLVRSPVKEEITPQPQLTPNRRKRVGLYLQQGHAWPTSSAFIRLIAPLTTDYACTKLDLVYLDDIQDPRLGDCDICVIQRIAVREDKDAQTLLDRLQAMSIPLFVDTDDAFFCHEQHKNDDFVLQKLMAAAQETWFSTPDLERLYKNVPGAKRVLPNNLDPRLWRNYRKPVNTSFTSPKVRFLYMGTATHDADFFDILPAFEKLARVMPGRFELTLVGAVRKPPQHSWLKFLPPPAEKGAYPQFVRWLVENSNFDVGIAPLVDSTFNHAKSDIKILDYGALGLLSLVSDCPAYKDAITAGLAIGCKNAADWYDQAAQIVGNPSKFEDIRQRAMAYVWQQRNTLKESPVIVDILSD